MRKNSKIEFFNVCYQIQKYSSKGGVCYYTRIHDYTILFVINIMCLFKLCYPRYFIWKTFHTESQNKMSFMARQKTILLFLSYVRIFTISSTKKTYPDESINLTNKLRARGTRHEKGKRLKRSQKFFVPSPLTRFLRLSAKWVTQQVLCMFYLYGKFSHTKFFFGKLKSRSDWNTSPDLAKLRLAWLELINRLAC